MRQVFYYKMRQFYYKMQQLLQIVTILLQNASYYKMRRLLRIATVQSAIENRLYSRDYTINHNENKDGNKK